MTQATQSKISQFASRAEEAAFWDSHDITDFLDELEPVDVEFAENLTESITIRLTPEMLARLRALARQRGLHPSTLARIWIREQLFSAQSPSIGDQRVERNLLALDAQGQVAVKGPGD